MDAARQRGMTESEMNELRGLLEKETLKQQQLTPDERTRRGILEQKLEAKEVAERVREHHRRKHG